MKVRRRILAGLAVAALVPAAGGVFAHDGCWYGHQLMTPEERTAHRQTMRNLETAEAREAYRLAHHESMRARAAEQGVTLPEKPLPGGPGYGRGMGPRWSN